MSLWHKEVDDITFADVDAFLTTRQPEGGRLDYKVNLSSDKKKLAKTIAAFANTIGGLIFLGVDARKDDNQPIWPPTAGMEPTAGLPDLIVQLASERIYPPVPISYTLVDNERLPGHVILVIRIDESIEAPHAVEHRKEVYVYERRDNKGEPHPLADIDRIKYLLDRRNAIESKRDEVVRQTFVKIEKLLEKGMNPHIWVCVTPVYPWRHLCQPSECHGFLREWAQVLDVPQTVLTRVQRVPQGALLTASHVFNRATDRPTYAASARVDGTVGIMRTMFQLHAHHGLTDMDPLETNTRTFAVEGLWPRIVDLLDRIRKFYRRPSVEIPGMVKVDLALRSVHGCKLMGVDHQSGAAYGDEHYEDSITMAAEAFLKADDGFQTMKDRLVFGFDLDTPVGL